MPEPINHHNILNRLSTTAFLLHIDSSKEFIKLLTPLMALLNSVAYESMRCFMLDISAFALSTKSHIISTSFKWVKDSSCSLNFARISILDRTSLITPSTLTENRFSSFSMRTKFCVLVWSKFHIASISFK